MKLPHTFKAAFVVCFLAASALPSFAQNGPNEAATPLNFKHFRHWQLPATAPYPADNKPTPARVALGKVLFFDPRLSRDGSMSCATCHNPMLGWSDGLDTGVGFQGKKLERASPTIINTAFNTIQMWDGRKKDLEDQAMGPLEAAPEMNTDIEKFFTWINSSQDYKKIFAEAYPNETIGPGTLRKALASYERTIISRTSPFDRWIAGDKKAMAPQQLRGLALFMDKNRSNCTACHSVPNFTDNGFHNIGLASFGMDNPDLGRFVHKPVAVLKGAFKTPGLRDVERTAPYFHDGSAQTLMDVVEHYNKGGQVRTNLSRNIKPLNLLQEEKEDLVAFLKALTSPAAPVTLPRLPQY